MPLNLVPKFDFVWIVSCSWSNHTILLLMFESLLQSRCKTLTAGICLPLGPCKGTVSGLWKTVEFSTGAYQGWGQFRFCNSNSNSNSGIFRFCNSNSNSNSRAYNSNSNSNSRSSIPIPIPIPVINFSNYTVNTLCPNNGIVHPRLSHDWFKQWLSGLCLQHWRWDTEQNSISFYFSFIHFSIKLTNC